MRDGASEIKRENANLVKVHLDPPCDSRLRCSSSRLCIAFSQVKLLQPLGKIKQLRLATLNAQKYNTYRRLPCFQQS